MYQQPRTEMHTEFDMVRTRQYQRRFEKKECAKNDSKFTVFAENFVTSGDNFKKREADQIQTESNAC